jgi:SAM-dependent methyltransferase
MGEKKPRPEQWEQFAREDAEYFVQVPRPGHDEFFAHGRRLVRNMLAVVSPYLPARDLAVEIGCGTGRLAIPMAHHFKRVIAVDIAPTMLGHLQANCERFGVENVVGMLADDEWEQPETADLVYSREVFQHIVDASVIAAYGASIRQVLKPDGVAYLHFDTRPATVAYRARNLTPDYLLPRPWRRGIRRIRRSVAFVEALVERHSFRMLAEHGRESREHCVLLGRPKLPADTQTGRFARGRVEHRSSSS